MTLHRPGADAEHLPDLIHRKLVHIVENRDLGLSLR
jgi:hypothetical protein